MKKNIIRSVCFVIITIFILGYVYKVLSWKDTTGDYLSSMTQLYETDDKLIDVMFAGSSHCYCSVDPARLWSESGIAAFDVAVSGQDKYSTYHHLKEALKTQAPKVVCVELYGLLFERHAVIGNEYRNMLAMKTSRNSVELVNDYIDESNRSDYLLRWPIVHTRYRELDKYDFITMEYSTYGRGEALTDYSGSGHLNEWASEVTDVATLSDSNVKWLNDMCNLADTEDFVLIFYFAPFYATEEEQKIINAAKAYAVEHERLLVDFNELADAIGFEPFYDMCDDAHCNRRGQDKITDWFNSYLSENFPLIDHRNDSRYYQWDMDVLYHSQLEQSTALSNTEDFHDYLELLANMDYTTTILSLDGDFKDCWTYLADYFGIDPKEAEKGGKWIYEFGEATKILDADSNSDYIVILNDFDAVKVSNLPIPSNIMLNNTPKGCITDGLNILVYDNLSNKEISVNATN